MGWFPREFRLGTRPVAIITGICLSSRKRDARRGQRCLPHSEFVSWAGGVITTSAWTSYGKTNLRRGQGMWVVVIFSSRPAVHHIDSIHITDHAQPIRQRVPQLGIA